MLLEDTNNKDECRKAGGRRGERALLFKYAEEDAVARKREQTPRFSARVGLDEAAEDKTRPDLQSGCERKIDRMTVTLPKTASRPHTMFILHACTI